MARTYTRGLDVSQYQGKVPWKQLYANGERFAFIRVGDGLGKDPNYYANMREAREEGFKVGGYLFYRASKDQTAQAETMLQLFEEGDLAPWFDFETLDGLDPKEVIEKVLKMLFQDLVGKNMVLYSYPYFLNQLSNSVLTSHYHELVSRSPIAIAHYNVEKPLLPKFVHEWQFWQYDGDKGLVMPNGRDADFVYFAGDESYLDHVKWLRADDLYESITEVPPKPEKSFNEWVSGLDLTDQIHEMLDQDNKAYHIRRNAEEEDTEN